jgi:hypothetical protein
MNGGLIKSPPAGVTTWKLEIGTAGTGILNLNGGLIQRNVNDFILGPNGTINVNGGTLEVGGDITAELNAAAAAGQIATDGTISISYDAGANITTLTNYAHDLAPVPADGGWTPSTTTELTWTLPEPNGVGVVTCDVTFGTDPNMANMIDKTLTTDAGESLTVALDYDEVYYWQITVHDPELPDMQSLVLTFNTSNLLPIADAGADRNPWLAYGDLTLDGSGSVDPDTAPNLTMTYAWEIVGATATFVDSGTAFSTLVGPVMDLSGGVGAHTVNLTVDDGEDNDTDSVTVTVGEDQCAAAQAVPGFAFDHADLDLNCIVNAVDLGVMALNWLDSNGIDLQNPPNGTNY